jgi:hypothetical protein
MPYDTTHDNPDNYSISVLWYTNQRVEAIKTLRKAGVNHNLSLMACKQALEEVLGGTFGSTTFTANESWNGLRRNSTLIVLAANIQQGLDAEKEQEAKDWLLLTRLKDALAAVPTSGHEYDEYGHYVGPISTDEDYATLGRTVLRIYSNYVK